MNKDSRVRFILDDDKKASNFVYRPPVGGAPRSMDATLWGNWKMSKWDDLITLCPRLYRDGILFECGQGWYDIIHDLSIKIERLIEKYEKKHPIVQGDEMFAVQVKEKYGTLRFYMSAETDEISALIWGAEGLSKRVCETCGAFGKLRSADWLSVQCDKCYEKKPSCIWGIKWVSREEMEKIYPKQYEENKIHNCTTDELEIAHGRMYYYDCEGILRIFYINYCPFCGERFIN